MELPDIESAHVKDRGKTPKVHKLRLGDLVPLEAHFKEPSAYAVLVRPGVRHLGYLAWHCRRKAGDKHAADTDFDDWVEGLTHARWADDDNDDDDSEDGKPDPTESAGAD